jgi:AcrR family transcriptional regulator
MEKGDRYNGIIRSCIDTFASTNYDKATTALLAKEAGIAEGTLYKYFASKKELFLECVRYIEGQLIERYTRIYEETRGRPLEYVKRVALSYQEYVRENPNVRKFMAFLLNNTYDDDFRNELVGFLNLNIAMTERSLAAAMQAGELGNSVDPHVAAWFFVGGYFTLVLMYEIEGEDALDPGFLREYLDILFQPGEAPGTFAGEAKGDGRSGV